MVEPPWLRLKVSHKWVDSIAKIILQTFCSCLKCLQTLCKHVPRQKIYFAFNISAHITQNSNLFNTIECNACENLRHRIWLWTFRLGDCRENLFEYKVHKTFRWRSLFVSHKSMWYQSVAFVLWDITLFAHSYRVWFMGNGWGNLFFYTLLL